MFIDVDYFDYVVKREKTTKDAVADACDCDRSTLRRRIKNGKITVNDMHSMIACLSLSWEDIRRIFFATKGAEMHFSEQTAL